MREPAGVRAILEAALCVRLFLRLRASQVLPLLHGGKRERVLRRDWSPVLNPVRPLKSGKPRLLHPVVASGVAFPQLVLFPEIMRNRQAQAREAE
ncbi:hypothetical protein ACRRTK_006273 [Alexandromys fortis]